MGNLTPFDAEMMMMVESLTGDRPIDTRFDDHFTVHASYRNCKDDPEKISAIIDAVRGRLGERLTEVNDRPDLSLVMFTIKYDETQYPTVDGFGDEAKPELERGEMYIRYTEDSRAEKCRLNAGRTERRSLHF